MTPLKVYLAAPFQLKLEMRKRAQELRALGLEVTSSWLEEPHEASIQLSELPPAVHQKYAVADVEDVWKADILVFQPDITKTIIRAGRHVEFGIAVGIGERIRPYPIFVVGLEYENIFHYLPQVYHFPAWEYVVAKLVNLQTIRGKS